MKSVRCVLQDGTVHYYNDAGKLHREDGPAVEFCTSKPGGVRWYFEGKKHRIGGPAIIRDDGATEWWVDGHRHREDGPAVELSDGTNKWFYRGNRVDCRNLEEFNRLVNLKAFW